MTPKRIIWHHSADPSTKKQFTKINEYHKNRGFPLSSRGFYVGYHWLVEQDGTAVQSREERELGAHDNGENLDSIGICLAGDFNTQLPSEAQTKAACTLLEQIIKRWHISIVNVEPHRTDDMTDCPGRNLTDNWLLKEMLKRSDDHMLQTFLWIGENRGIL